MKFILIGSSGYIGSHFVDYFKSQNISYVCLSGHKCYNLDFLRHFMFKYQPKFLLNCAGTIGKPNVDAVEKQKIDALNANAYLPFLLSRVCQEFDVTLCHISTGCIFNGYEKEFNEKDRANFHFDSLPCSYYSGSKYLGELLIRDNQNAYIFRIRIPFNADIDNPRNLLYKLINYSQLVNIKNSMTGIDEFITLSSKIILENKNYGIYHIVNSNPIFPREIMEILLKTHVITRKQFENKKYFETYNEFEKVIKTPRSNCILSNTKLLSLGLTIPDTATSIEKYALQYKSRKERKENLP